MSKNILKCTKFSLFLGVRLNAIPVRVQLTLGPVVAVRGDGVHHGEDEAVDGERHHLDVHAARLHRK